MLLISINLQGSPGGLYIPNILYVRIRYMDQALSPKNMPEGLSEISFKPRPGQA